MVVFIPFGLFIMFSDHTCRFFFSIMKGYDTKDVICLPSCAGLPLHAEVSIHALSDLIDAISLHVEPVSVEDWELLESNAEWLEDGGLLQQVSIVYPDQIIRLRVGGLDYANIRILPESFLQFQTTINDHDNIWPNQSLRENLDDTKSSSILCLRLVADTQVIVTPKPRGNNRLSKSLFPLRVVPSLEDLSDSDFFDQPGSFLSAQASSAISTCPGSVVVHRDVYESIFGFQCDLVDTFCGFARLTISNPEKDKITNDNVGCFSIVRVSSSLGIPSDCIGKLVQVPANAVSEFMFVSFC